MKTFVDGVCVELTEEQIKHIEATKKEREKEFKTFKSMLLSFGFKKIEGCKNAYGLDSPDCFAEILDHENYNSLWMIGKYLKGSNSFPGGFNYGDPKEAAKEIQKAINIINNTL